MSATPYRLPIALLASGAPGEGAIAGVCAGIANGLRVDPTLARLTFALLAPPAAPAFLRMAARGSRSPRERTRAVGAAAYSGMSPAVAGAIALRGFASPTR